MADRYETERPGGTNTMQVENTDKGGNRTAWFVAGAVVIALLVVAFLVGADNDTSNVGPATDPAVVTTEPAATGDATGTVAPEAAPSEATPPADAATPPATEPETVPETAN